MQVKLNVVLVVLVLGALAVSIFVWVEQPQTAFVNTIEVYNGFELKKELEGKMEEVKKARGWIMDSLELHVKTVGQQIRDAGAQDESELKRYEVLRQQYFLKQQQFEEDNQALADQYTEQIWKQLNQYIKDFGKKHQYEYIFGTQGQGRLMYAEEAKDITEELAKYVNDRYSGGEY